MRQFLPQNVLLVLAVAVMLLAAYYNLALRHDFGVAIRYELPQPPQRPESQPPEQPVVQWDDDDWDEDWEGNLDLPEQPADEVTVLVQFPLDVNTATEQQLVHIPSIGSATAQRIVQYREHLGGYTELVELKGIRGIGDNTFETIAPYLYVPGEGEYIHPDER